MLLLDGRHRLIAEEEVSWGTLTASLVHPREVFREAIRVAAAALILVHNHPSGDPRPSAEDRAVTRRLVGAGRLIGIDVLDHVIVSEGGHWSFQEAGEPLEGAASDESARASASVAGAVMPRRGPARVTVAGKGAATPARSSREPRDCEPRR